MGALESKEHLRETNRVVGYAMWGSHMAAAVGTETAE